MRLWSLAVLLVLQTSACSAEEKVVNNEALVLEPLIVVAERPTELKKPIEAWKHRGTFKRDLIRLYGHSRYLNLVGAQIDRESNWIHDAESWVGAYGCGQFMPATQGDAKYWARDLGKIDWGNCRQSVRASIRYMKAILRRIKVPSHIKTEREAEAYIYREAVKDYNRGMGNGDKERKLGYCVRRTDACEETEIYHKDIFGKRQIKFLKMGYGKYLII